jgi:hypothetical protein
MKALAETFPDPGHTNGRGLDPFRTCRGHRAGSTSRRRTGQKPDNHPPIYHRYGNISLKKSFFNSSFSLITGRAVSSVNQHLLTVVTLSLQYRFKRPILNPGLSELYELRKCYKKLLLHHTWDINSLKINGK